MHRGQVSCQNNTTTTSKCVAFQALPPKGKETGRSRTGIGNGDGNGAHGYIQQQVMEIDGKLTLSLPP